jgi:hypothetical protein
MRNIREKRQRTKNETRTLMWPFKIIFTTDSFLQLNLCGVHSDTLRSRNHSSHEDRVLLTRAKTALE